MQKRRVKPYPTMGYGMRASGASMSGRRLDGSVGGRGRVHRPALRRGRTCRRSGPISLGALGADEVDGIGVARLRDAALEAATLGSEVVGDAIDKPVEVETKMNAADLVTKVSGLGRRQKGYDVRPLTTYRSPARRPTRTPRTRSSSTSGGSFRTT